MKEFKQKLLLLILLLGIMGSSRGQNIGSYINSRDSVGSASKPTTPTDSKMLIIPSDEPDNANSYSISIHRLSELIGSGQSSGGGSSTYQTVKVTLSSAQILDLHNTPVIVVPAQGANTIVEVLTISGIYNYGTTAYTESSFPSASIRYTGAPRHGGVLAIQSSVLTATQSQYSIQEETRVTSNNLSDVVNNSVEVYLIDGSYIGGDGTVDLYTTFQTIDLN